LIWGRVKAAGVLALYFTAHSGETSSVSSYALDATLELPAKFDGDLGAAIAARVLALGTALLNRRGNFVTPYAEHFAKQIEPLVEISKPGWPPEARGAVLYAFGLAKALAGEEHGDVKSLERAVLVLDTALKEYPHNTPLRRAAIQNTLGNALRALGEREVGTKHLEKAVEAYREALTAYADVPLLRAATQNNLGNSLQAIGAREVGTARLEEAAIAHREALKVLTLKRSPNDYAAIEHSLGNALVMLAERETDNKARLEEAAIAYGEALKIYTRRTTPLYWAGTQINLATALRMIGERERGREQLKRAIAAYRKALTVYSRNHSPLDWAMTTGNQAIAMKLLADRNDDFSMAEEAVANMTSALQTFQDSAHEAFKQEIESQLASTKLLVERLRPR
jgi:tetratricopeptide (TPR) repeat protein